MSIEGLMTRQSEIKVQIDKVEGRIHKPPPFTYYNPRDDLSLASELHKYLKEIETELCNRNDVT
jgi:hypothetical protein